jgi:hypothetical protein
MAGILDIYSPDDIMNDVFPRLSYAPMDNLGYGKAYELATPYTAMASRYGYGENPSLKQGLGSDVRHTTGSALAKFAMQDYLKNNFGVPTDSSLSDKLSNLGLYTSTGIQEIQDAYKNVRNLTGYGVDFRDALNRGLVQPMEDVTANIRAKNIPYGTPVEGIIKYAVENSPSKYMQAAPQISSLNSFGPQNYETPQEKVNNNFLKTLSNLVFTPAGAAEVTPGNVQNQSLDSFNNLVSDTVMAEPKTGIMNIETPKGFDYNFDENVLKEEEDAQYNLDNKRSFNMDGIVQNLKDYLPFIGDKSITGTLTRGIGQFFNNIGDRIPSTPQYQRYTPGYNYGNLNPNLIDDFYDPATGLNRFDRAKTLFGQSRTLSEYLSKKREGAAAAPPSGGGKDSGSGDGWSGGSSDNWGGGFDSSQATL